MKQCYFVLAGDLNEPNSLLQSCIGVVVVPRWPLRVKPYSLLVGKLGGYVLGLRFSTTICTGWPWGPRYS